MSRSYKARNKRIIQRGRNGRFRKTTMADFGIGGVCETCNHFMVRHYDGDESEPFIDPRLFRYRCFTCEPMTEEEQRKADEKLEDERKKNNRFWEALEDIVNECEK